MSYESLFIPPSQSQWVGDLIIDDGFGILIGYTAFVAAGLTTAELQMIGVGRADTQISLLSYQTGNTYVEAPHLAFIKSTTATMGGVADALVADNEVLGGIGWFGADGVDLDTETARLFVEVDDASPEIGGIGTALVVELMAGGGTTAAREVFRLSAAGDLIVANGGGIVIGNPVKITGSLTNELQMLGTAGADAGPLFARFSADAAGALVDLLKSRHATIGSNTIVEDDDRLGTIRFIGADGVDLATVAAEYFGEVDDADPEAGFIGMAHVWQSMAGGNGNATREVGRFAANGDLSVTVGDLLMIAGRIQGVQGADVASTNNLVLGGDGNVFEITGTTDINLLSNLQWQNGSTVILLFTSTATVKDGQTTSTTNITILLDGSADFVPSAGDTLQLTLGEIGGTQAWRETGSRNVL